MSFIGRIEVPELTPTEVFPVVPDYGSGRALKPEVYVHTFKTDNVKIEQRFLAGTGTNRFQVRINLNRVRRAALRSFWDAVQGAYEPFYFDAPNDDYLGTTRYVCRFADRSITYDHLTEAISTVGVGLVEVPQEIPSYGHSSTETRFPSAGLASALLDQVQILIPLIKIRVTEDAVPDIFLSDRDCTIGGQLYQARLLDWDGISQRIGGPADQARSVLGNADRVMTLLAGDTDLWRAAISFSLFPVGTRVKVDFWSGYVTDWSLVADSQEFTLFAADGLYELTLLHPTRRITRTCWKDVGDQVYCFAVAGFCNKSFENCQALEQTDRFGGIVAKPQAIRTKDNSTGHWGYGRSPLTSVSQVADWIYGETLPEYYVNNWSYPLKVNAKLVAGRDEGDFAIGLGIVGEGPLGAYGFGHKLDGQYNHGPGGLGLRESLGNDPNPDPFSLGEGGHNPPQTYGPERAAGTAFVELRRTDSKGLQLSKLCAPSAFTAPA